MQSDSHLHHDRHRHVAGVFPTIKTITVSLSCVGWLEEMRGIFIALNKRENYSVNAAGLRNESSQQAVCCTLSPREFHTQFLPSESYC